ncbi:MAG: rhomboid family intramembrane serine protease [Acidobacteriota bacterium]
MCRGCGAIVGPGQARCAVCGSATATQAPDQKPRRGPDRETIRFARAVLNRPYKFTITLLVANIFLFLLMWQSSGLSFSVLNSFPPQVLLVYGAKLNALIQAGQWWRFVTPMFIHVNLIHLLVNMYSLWIIGPYVEKLYGSAKFVSIWVLTGIAGVLASYLTVVGPDTPLGSFGHFLFKQHDDPSAGASGALFGLVGVLFVFGIKFRHELPEGFKRAFGTGLMPMILLNLFIGYLGRGIIDNAAHLGGLAAGAALALVVDYRRPGDQGKVQMFWRILQVTSIIVVIISFAMVARHLGDPISGYGVSPLKRSEQNRIADFVTYSKAINDAQEALGLALLDGDGSHLDSALTQLTRLPALDPQADIIRERLRGLLVEAKDFNATIKLAPGPSNDLLQRRGLLLREFDSWKAEYNEWLTTEGRKQFVPVESANSDPANN